MKYGAKYQIQFTNQERNNVTGAFVGQVVDIGIYDTSFLVDPSVTQQVYDLTPGGDPLHISSVDNSEDKFTPIRAIQARIEFNSDPQFNLDTFADAPLAALPDPGDPRWYVEIKCNSKIIFKGFLNLDDCSESFMPDPNVVTLIANDGLGVLKNIPLVAQNFKTIRRDVTGANDGIFNVNVLTLNGFTSITLPQNDLNHNIIPWVGTLQAGDQIELTVAGDTTHSAIYSIDSITSSTLVVITFAVTNVSGDAYNMTPTENYYIRKVGDPFVPNGYNRIADYLAWALLKTGLKLNLRAVFNIRDAFSTEFSTSVQFNAGVNIISVPIGYNFFYIGEVVTISGTASNNGTYHVTSVVPLGFLGTLVTVIEALVDETGVTATFQDEKFHFFDKEYLHARTFEDEIGTCINCYDVIVKIIGVKAFLTQRSGEWWVYRIDETEETLNYNIAKFLSDGTYDSFITGSTDFGQQIEKDTERIFFSQESTEYLQTSQHKFIELDYRFEYPKETPCNTDFSRGDFISTLPDENDENGNPCTVKKYNLECWTMKRGFPLRPPITNDSLAFIKRLFNSTDQEVQRYVDVTPPSAVDVNQPYIESEAIPVSVKDKFNISVDFRFPTSITSGTGYYKIMYVILQGDDGSWWIYGSDEPGNTSEPKWYNTNLFTVFTSKGEKGFDWVTTESGVDWATQSFNCDPAPVSGNVYVWLHGFNANAAGFDDIDIYYQNLQFTYFPYVNGSYQRYTQLSSRVSRNPNYWASRTEEVFISDGIKKLFKGALFMNQGGAYALVNQFFDWKKTPTPIGGEISTFLHFQTFDFWNQHRNVMKVFRANLQGLCSDIVGGDSELYYPSLIHTYYLLDTHQSTNNRRFMLLTFDQDWYTCEWKGTFVEMFNLIRGKSYEDTDTLEVKYQ